MLKSFIKSKFLIFFIIFSFVLGIFSSNFIFADDNYTTIVIEEGGNTQTGPIIKNQEPWYPGYSESNVLKVQNNLGREVTINELGMNISLSRKDMELDFSDNNAIDFLNNFKVEIEYKNPVSSLIYGEIFNGNLNEFRENIDTSIKLKLNDSIHLIYTITMDKNSQINVAGITANMDFTVGISENKKNSHTISVYSNTTDESGSGIAEVDEQPEPPALEDEHWSHDCIKSLIKNGMVEGYEDGSIKPERKITRAESAILIARALNIEPDDDETFAFYVDEIPEWAKGYITALTKKGILDGYDDKTFKSHRYISRQEMTTALVKAFELQLSSTYKLQFKDKDEISKWAIEFIKAGVNTQAIEGYPDNSFRPKMWITRAESFTLICKLTGLHETHKVKEE